MQRECACRETALITERVQYLTFVHLCYVDDSGKDGIITFTGLLVADAGWNDVLHAWLDGRRQLTETWGVKKKVELHANQLTKAGRGLFCETVEQNRAFQSAAVRARAVDILLQRLGQCEALTVTTVAARAATSAAAYEAFITHLEKWAISCDTQVVVVLDGQEGPIDTTGLSYCKVALEREAAYRNAVHYRDVHRGLDLDGRHIIEDPILHDSRWSQLIQAADLTAYATYQHLWADRSAWPSGGRHGQPNLAIAKALDRLSARWIQGSDHGVQWAS